MRREVDRRRRRERDLRLLRLLRDLRRLLRDLRRYLRRDEERDLRLERRDRRLDRRDLRRDLRDLRRDLRDLRLIFLGTQPRDLVDLQSALLRQAPFPRLPTTLHALTRLLYESLRETAITTIWIIL